MTQDSTQDKQKLLCLHHVKDVQTVTTLMPQRELEKVRDSSRQRSGCASFDSSCKTCTRVRETSRHPQRAVSEAVRRCLSQNQLARLRAAESRGCRTTWWDVYVRSARKRCSHCGSRDRSLTDLLTALAGTLGFSKLRVGDLQTGCVSSRPAFP